MKDIQECLKSDDDIAKSAKEIADGQFHSFHALRLFLPILFNIFLLFLFVYYQTSATKDWI